ncbi:MAG: hypothetical protein WCZ89_03930, partial [Phycisphaerae bacterium]
MAKRFIIAKSLVAIITITAVLSCPVWAVTSKITRHRSSVDFEKGKTENIIISSRGTLQLAQASRILAEDFENVWSISSIVSTGGKIYIGTSPNGGVYEYKQEKLNEIYSATGHNEETSSGDTNEVPDVNRRLANEHIFAMAADKSGKLLVGISGRRCVLGRLEGSKLQTIFEPDDARYIFAIVTDSAGNIYLGTGPMGKIYKLNPQGTSSEVLYTSTDKNILSLALTNDGSLLAGTDSSGLVYKIDPKTKNVRVLYDAPQPEITSLLVTNQGDIYATATSAQIVQAQQRSARQIPMAGRPESQQDGESSSGQAAPLQLRIPTTQQEGETKTPQPETPQRRPVRPDQMSYVYKITKEGFVTDVFRQSAVLFAMAQQNSNLLLATGNRCELFTVDPVTEQEAVIFKDEQSSQITAMAVVGDEVYLGTANPAKLIKLEKNLVSKGIYTSAPVDASQPANWGKLQIDADIPEGAKITLEARSGNVGDANHASFSDWTKPVEIKEPAQLGCPLGRYCQYRLTLHSPDGVLTPVIREVAAASTVPNLAPRVEEVTVQRIDKPDKQGVFKIDYKARDENQDTLIYKIDFRKVGRSGWIELKDIVETASFEWDTKTVEDGHYEIRVTASDERSNSAATKLTGSRISEPFIVDNIGPVIELRLVQSNGKA